MDLKTNLYASVYLSAAFLLISGGSIPSESPSATRAKLLKDYDKLLSPVLFNLLPSNTNIYLFVQRIRGLDDSKGEFVVDGMLLLSWPDQRLVSQTSPGPGLKSEFFVDIDKIWSPQINILNSIEDYRVNERSTVVFYQVGVVFAVFQEVFRTACTPDSRYFPFDRHECEIVIDSVSHEGDFLDGNYTLKTQNRGFKSKAFIENPQWNLLSVRVHSEKRRIGGDAESVVGVYTIQFARTMPLVALGVLAPSLVCLLLLLTTFWMQADATSRPGLSVVSTLVCTSSLLTLARVVPRGGESTPIIVQYAAVTLIMSSICTLHTIFMSILTRCKKQPPVSYVTIIGKFPKWALLLLALETQSTAPTHDEESFSFSKLTELATEDSVATEDSTEDSTTTQADVQADDEVAIREEKCLWERHIVLWDRLHFYIFATVLLLLILSVLITE